MQNLRVEILLPSVLEQSRQHRSARCQADTSTDQHDRAVVGVVLSGRRMGSVNSQDLLAIRTILTADHDVSSLIAVREVERETVSWIHQLNILLEFTSPGARHRVF